MLCSFICYQSIEIIDCKEANGGIPRCNMKAAVKASGANVCSFHRKMQSFKLKCFEVMAGSDSN